MSSTAPVDEDFVLLGDEPNTETDDPLGFDRIARELANTIGASRRSTPFTLGIEGGWGTGKSSLMRRLDVELCRHPDVTTAWFNAWAAEDAGALEGLIKTVLERLDPNVLRRALRNKKLLSWARALGLVAASWLRLGNVVDLAWQRVSSDARARNELRALLHEAVKDWRDRRTTLSEGSLLVIFVDDLDRASPRQVLEVFEAMKLYLDAPGFVFVIGYDSAIVSEAVLEEKKYSRSVTGREYLEKVIQIGYRIARPTDAQSERLIDDYIERSRTGDLFDAAAQTLVAERNDRNPRRIKRFLNTFVLEFALDTEWHRLGAARLVDVLILYMYFPDFARLFDVPNDANPIDEFLNYVEHRAAVLADQGDPAALAALETNLPEPYPQLATDRNFVGVLRRLQDAPNAEEVYRKLERRESPFVSMGDRVEEPHLPPPAKTGEWVHTPGPTIVWIDDRPENNLLELALARDQGWSVFEAADLDSARSLLRRHRVDVLVSDVDREGRRNAGFADLSTLRSEGFEGPVIFYTGRLTPDRRAQAERLGARITSSREELLAMIRDVMPPTWR